MIQIGKTALSLHTTARPGGVAASVIRQFFIWRALRQSRKALSRLDDRMLMDIGLDRQAADREIARWR